MKYQTIQISYIVIANDRPLQNVQPTHALVWKKELELTDISAEIQPTPDWCYDQILAANPDFEDYTIAIWAVDITSSGEIP